MRSLNYWALSVIGSSILGPFAAFGAMSCRESYELLARHRYGKIERVELSMQPVSDPTPEEIAVLEELERNGGAGRVVIKNEVVYRSGRRPIRDVPKRFIEILEAPKNDIYGENFNLIFEQLRSRRIPVFYSLDLKWPRLGYVDMAVSFHSKDKGALVFHPHLWSDRINAHEYQHILDLLIDQDSFFAAAPKLPEGFNEIIRKLQAGKKLTVREKAKVEHIFDRLDAFLEVRANREELRRTLKSTTTSFFSEQKAASNVVRLWQVAVDLNYAELQMLYHGLWVHPADPAHIYIVLKVGSFGYMVYRMSALTGDLVSYAFSSESEDIPKVNSNKNSGQER